MTKLIVAFRNFANAPKISGVNLHIQTDKDRSRRVFVIFAKRRLTTVIQILKLLHLLKFL